MAWAAWARLPFWASESVSAANVSSLKKMVGDAGDRLSSRERKAARFFSAVFRLTAPTAISLLSCIFNPSSRLKKAKVRDSINVCNGDKVFSSLLQAIGEREINRRAVRCKILCHCVLVAVRHAWMSRRSRLLGKYDFITNFQKAVTSSMPSNSLPLSPAGKGELSMTLNRSCPISSLMVVLGLSFKPRPKLRRRKLLVSYPKMPLPPAVVLPSKW